MKTITESNASPNGALRCKPVVALLVAALLATAGSSTSASDFFDDFSGPDLNPAWQPSLPNANLAIAYWGTTHTAAYTGAPNFTFESLDGSSVLRMSNILNPLQRRGWCLLQALAAPGFRYEVRFNTLSQSSASSIDAFIEIGILDAADPSRYDITSPYGGEYSTWRMFCAGSSIDNAYVSPDYSYQNNTWYRLVLAAAPGDNIRASLLSDAGVELIGHTFAHGADAFPSGFRIFLSQAMGQPIGAYPGDVAVDYARLTLLPEPGAAALAGWGLIVCTLLRGRVRAP